MRYLKWNQLQPSARIVVHTPRENCLKLLRYTWQHEVLHEPVFGLKEKTDFEVVTLRGDEELGWSDALLLPNGRVTDGEARIYPCVDQWRVDMCKFVTQLKK